jgi:hypothetical protein
MKAMSSSLRWSAAALAAVVLITGTAAPLCAQSLADLAKKEEERRKAIKEPAKLYTNKDLVNVPPPEGSRPATDTTAVSTDATKDADKNKDKPKDGEPARDQKYWSGRLKMLQTQLERDEAFAEALQSRINGLNTDFVARDDPAQKAIIGQNRQKALVELERLKLAIVSDKKALADLAEEARKAGVPPGWLR